MSYLSDFFGKQTYKGLAFRNYMFFWSCINFDSHTQGSKNAKIYKKGQNYRFLKIFVDLNPVQEGQKIDMTENYIFSKNK